MSPLEFFTGSPLQFYVDAINSGHVTAYGPGLSHGAVNRAAAFTIVTKDAGEGTVSMSHINTFHIIYGQVTLFSHVVSDTVA